MIRYILLLSLLIFIAAPACAGGAAINDSYGGRDMLLHVPAQLPPTSKRALVLVLHGGMGQASRIESSQSESRMSLDGVADQHGFIVAYLNGTPVTRFMGDKFKGWNAGGGCCGQPYRKNIDDVGYITGAAAYLEKKYGVSPARVFAIGHSNGAIMIQRMMCETKVLAAGIAVSGPLNLDDATCPAAKGARILGIHGADDQNVPIAGGRGAKGISGVNFKSEAYAQRVYAQAGAHYTLKIVPGADHNLNRIDAALQKTDGMTLADEAVAFFGLDK
jgi:polyhydroxybutyrate depolymerase